MQYTYKINGKMKTASNVTRLEINADEYHLKDGFFDFLAFEGGTRVKVASVKADLVFEVERTDVDSAK